MGCSCCRMIKSYIFDPSVPVDVSGHKQDLTSSSLYQSHRFPGEADHIDKKQGVCNLGYSTQPSPSKLEIDNNHINCLHANIPGDQVRPIPARSDPSFYILQPEGEGMPVHDKSMLGTEPGKREERFRDSGLGGGGIIEEEEDDRRSRVVSTPDTADAESVLSVDMHTSSTSLSSVDSKLEDRDEKYPSIMTGQQEREKEIDCLSITDSMVAEALAALDAATAGEDCE
ncbi:uncharacterized protein LOC127649874 [Xyrauchen texanus]|uniref:uncharacterized protein LOC127649874 n=1 Tax=Xyrauchen texanus TaxID=154827 RepID=UPI0022418E58|nr:uncharacterized protein LOC127649874 [Xyrauchen texanus]